MTSLKDLGKKWFAFSKIELDAIEMIKLTPRYCGFVIRAEYEN